MNGKRWLWLSLLSLMIVVPIVVVMAVYTSVHVPLDTPLDAQLANTFLATVAQVLAGILAIVFSFSLLAVQIASDRYTPRLFSYFLGDWSTWLALLSLVVCITIAVVSLGVQTIPMFQWGFLAMSWLFLFCLLAMMCYFVRIFWLLNPVNLAKRIREDGSQTVKRGDPRKFRATITSLGDVAIKAFERGEEEVVRECLVVLQDMQVAFVSTGLGPAFGSHEELMVALFGSGIPSPVVNQYFRVFARAVDARNEGLTKHVAELLSDTILTLIEKNGNEEILRGILVQQYKQFLNTAVEQKDSSRFSLLRTLKDALCAQPTTRQANPAYLPVCAHALGEANEILINHQDFAAWKEELNCFSRILSVEEISEWLVIDFGKLLGGIVEAGVSISHDQWTEWHSTVEPLRTRITDSNRRLFELTMSEVETLLPTSATELQDLAQKVEEGLRQLCVTTAVYDIFFRICVYALYRKRYDFIKGLWRHVNPPDAGTHWANTNLIHFNVGFLTYQMSARSSAPWDIEDYHGSEDYVYAYYLLALAYALQQAHGDWQPAVPDCSSLVQRTEDEYTLALVEDLRAVRRFLLDLPCLADRVLKQYENIAPLAEGWDDVFDGKTSQALERARQWLESEEHRQEWGGKAESVVRNMPLDCARVEAYTKAAQEFYRSRSQVVHLTTIGDTQEKNRVELSETCRQPCPDKVEFTALAIGGPEDVGKRVGFEVVDRILAGETRLIARTLLSQRRTKVIKSKVLNFGEILMAVKRIGDAGYSATNLLVPWDQLSFAWQDDPDFRSRLVHEHPERYVRIDGTTQLRLIEIDGDYAFVFDRDVGNWKTVQPLKIEVEQCGRDPLAVRITACETVDYQILKPDAAAIIKFRKPGKRKWTHSPPVSRPS